ncbi:MAG: ATP-binding protein, partial [Actinobacteria bacterium]|nr:ATP-binding protein [Actinomycetota bacterium]
MSDIDVPEHGEPQGDGGRADQLIGREPEMDRLRAFLAMARTEGAALLVTGEPGVGKTELLNAASEAASAADMRIIRASGVEFEAGTSFSVLNQVLLPLLSELPRLAAVHRD